MQSISLPALLEQYWHVTLPVPAPDRVDVVEAIRRQENFLRQQLPAWLVRRFDRGFARSNTVHPDTGWALYSICTASQARHIFETGTYWGYSTAYLAAALVDQGQSGRVYSFDLYPHAGQHIPKSLRPHVELHRGKPSVETMPAVLQTVVPDVFFQDSRHDYAGVLAELQVVAPYLQPGAVVLLHDFVEPNVRQAAIDGLPGYHLYVLETQDPQQLGVAIKA